MWVFDGEEWTQDTGGSTSPVKSDTTRRPQRVDEFVPELQILEIVPVTREPIPPFPFAIP